MYSYVTNNPLKYVDLDGYDRYLSCTEIWTQDYYEDPGTEEKYYYWVYGGQQCTYEYENDPQQSEIGPDTTRFQCAVKVAQKSSPAAAMGVENVPILGDLLGNSAADTAELGSDVIDFLGGSWAAIKPIAWDLAEGKIRKAATNAFVVTAAFRNSKIAKSIDKGFSSRTNLTKQFAKFAGKGKIYADVLVLGFAYLNTCSGLAK